MTAVGLRWVSPFGIFPAGRIQARLAVTPQFQPLGNPGATPAKIMPSKSPNPHMQLLRGLHQPRRSRDGSCAFRYGTGAQPDGVTDTASGEAVVAADQAAVAAAGLAARCRRWHRVVRCRRVRSRLRLPPRRTRRLRPRARPRPRPSRALLSPGHRHCLSGSGACGGRRRLLGRPWRRNWLPFPVTVSLRVLPIGVVRAGASGKPVPEGAHHDGALASHFLRSVGCDL